MMGLSCVERVAPSLTPARGATLVHEHIDGLDVLSPGELKEFWFDEAKRQLMGHYADRVLLVPAEEVYRKAQA